MPLSKHAQEQQERKLFQCIRWYSWGHMDAGGGHPTEAQIVPAIRRIEPEMASFFTDHEIALMAHENIQSL